MKDKLNEILRNVMKLLSARDKVLWEGEAGKGDTLTVPGLSDYSMAEVWTRYGHFFFDPRRGYVNGIHGDQSGSDDVPFTHQVHGTVNGDTLKITMCQYYNRVDTSETQTTIKKIIGVEPIMEKIVGGMGAAPKRIFGRFPDLVGRCLA